MPHPKPRIQTTTLWEYPSQHYSEEPQGDPDYPGATPSYVIWNCLVRWTRPKDLVVDPMAGSGTTLDVARDLGRRCLCYDIEPVRKEVFRADARRLPLEDGKADFIFVDPPYSDHIRYSNHPQCIGKIPASEPRYFTEMDKVIAEMDRVLRPGRYLAMYVCDSFRKGHPLIPIGFRLFESLARRFIPVDIIAVVRHNATLKRRHWHTAAIEGNYFLRGFNYLFVMFKPGRTDRPFAPQDRRDPEEVAHALETGTVPFKKKGASGRHGSGQKAAALRTRSTQRTE